MSPPLSHLDAQGNAVMVDVGSKDMTQRSAIAEGRIFMAAETLAVICEGTAKKGDVLGVAQLAGIMAAKRTPELIPLAHPLPLTSVEVTLHPDRAHSCVVIRARCKVTGQTGVEMEALCAVSVAALCVYDMVKAVDKSMTIGEVRLLRKSGGQSGDYIAPSA